MTTNITSHHLVASLERTNLPHIEVVEESANPRQHVIRIAFGTCISLQHLRQRVTRITFWNSRWLIVPSRISNRKYLSATTVNVTVQDLDQEDYHRHSNVLSGSGTGIGYDGMKLDRHGI